MKSIYPSQNKRAINFNAIELKHGFGDVDSEYYPSRMDGCFPLLVLNSTGMAHSNAVRLEPGHTINYEAVWL